MVIRGLSLTQPWATLVVIGAKKIETRSWSTFYRGMVAIHAAKTFPKWARDTMHTHPSFQLALKPFGYTSSTQLPLGEIIGVARLAGCYSTNDHTLLIPAQTSREYHFGDYSENRFMWSLEDVKWFTEGIPCKGALGLWTMHPQLITQIEERINRCAK